VDFARAATTRHIVWELPQGESYDSIAEQWVSPQQREFYDFLARQGLLPSWAYVDVKRDSGHLVARHKEVVAWSMRGKILGFHETLA